MSGFTERDVPDQTGRTIIVTGANTGIGFGGASILARKGARVLLACRDEAKARDAMTRILAETPDADLAFLPLDLGDLDSVRRAADLAGDEARIDALYNNAGIMMPPLRHTAQGFESQFGVNHLGVFALTGLLLDKLAQAPDPRIAVTSSLAHRRGHIAWDDLDGRQDYNKFKRYGMSKLANILHVLELDRRLRVAGSNIVVAGCHPGAASSDLGREMGNSPFVQKILQRFFNTSERGAMPGVQIVTAPDVISGGYYGPQGIMELRGASGPAKRAKQARSVADAKRLWDLSVELTGVDPGLPPA